jgi:hypothetical protein
MQQMTFFDKKCQEMTYFCELKMNFKILQKKWRRSTFFVSHFFFILKRSFCFYVQLSRTLK